MSKIYVTPAAGRTVLLPRTGAGTYPQVPTQGMWVDEDVFILRRLYHGDLVMTAPPTGAPTSDQTPQSIAAPGPIPATSDPTSNASIGGNAA